MDTSNTPAILSDTEKLARIHQIISMAGDWCKDQENALTDGTICISALKDIRRIIGKPSTEMINLNLGTFKCDGTPIGNKNTSLSKASVVDVIDHAAQLSVVIRNELAHISSGAIMNVALELDDALVNAEVIPENWDEHSENQPMLCHQCGEPFTINDDGTANHDDSDFDADHVPYSLERE